MARQMTVLAFDEEEKEILAAVHSAARIGQITKPLTDRLKADANTIKMVSSPKTVDEDQVRAALSNVSDMLRDLEGLPDSEARDEQLQALEAAKEVLDQAIQQTIGN